MRGAFESKGVPYIPCVLRSSLACVAVEDFFFHIHVVLDKHIIYSSPIYSYM